MFGPEVKIFTSNWILGCIIAKESAQGFHIKTDSLAGNVFPMTPKEGKAKLKVARALSRSQTLSHCVFLWKEEGSGPCADVSPPSYGGWGFGSEL